MRITIILVLLCLSTLSMAGPIFPNRCIVLAPQFRSPSDTVKGAKFLRQNGMWAEISKGFNSTGDRFYWGISTGGIIQLVEWEQSSLYFVGDYQLAADDHSSIHFHPRGIFWTEGLMYSIELGNTEFHTGYINRCHHDIDNLEFQPVGNGEERTLIYSSFLANTVWRNLTVAGLRCDLWSQLDWYVFKKDYLIPVPATLAATNFERLDLSLSAGGKLDLFSMGDAATYLRASGIAAGYNNYRTITLDARAELGIQLQGDATAMNIFLGFESLQDDGSRPMPVNSKYVYIGFRFIGRNIGL